MTSQRHGHTGNPQPSDKICASHNNASFQIQQLVVVHTSVALAIMSPHISLSHPPLAGLHVPPHQSITSPTCCPSCAVSDRKSAPPLVQLDDILMQPTLAFHWWDINAATSGISLMRCAVCSMFAHPDDFFLSLQCRQCLSTTFLCVSSKFLSVTNVDSFYSWLLCVCVCVCELQVKKILAICDFVLFCLYCVGM